MSNTNFFERLETAHQIPRRKLWGDCKHLDDIVIILGIINTSGAPAFLDEYINYINSKVAAGEKIGPKDQTFGADVIGDLGYEFNLLTTAGQNSAWEQFQQFRNEQQAGEYTYDNLDALLIRLAIIPKD